MGNCLNSLNNPEVFIPTAALIVLVLLVWFSIRRAPEDPKPTINLPLSIIWTYVALLSALVATAIFIFNNTCPWAKFFLILSFLMTIFNILAWLVTSFTLVFITGGKPLTGVAPDASLKEKWPWSAFWLIALVGLTILSLSAVGICKDYYMWSGIALLVVVIISGIRVLKERNQKWLQSTIIVSFILVALIVSLIIYFSTANVIRDCCWYILGAAILAVDACYVIWLVVRSRWWYQTWCFKSKLWFVIRRRRLFLMIRWWFERRHIRRRLDRESRKRK